MKTPLFSPCDGIIPQALESRNPDAVKALQQRGSLDLFSAQAHNSAHVGVS